MAWSEASLKASRARWRATERAANRTLTHARAMLKRRDAQIAAAVAARTPKVSPPLAHILQDSWGYHPGVHDGVDLICPPNEPLLAICRAKVVRADDAGWWGKGAPSDPDLKAKGDGIIILEALQDVGPLKKGMHFCYGHAEHATVKAGDVVQAGQVIGKAGFAVAWHVHAMVNSEAPVNGFYRGVGDRDPRPVIDYVRKEQR